jgi:hypothetical protein
MPDNFLSMLRWGLTRQRLRNQRRRIGVENRDYHYLSQNATVLGLLVISGFPDTYPARGTLPCNLRSYPLCMHGNLTNTATRAINSKEVSCSESLFRFRETVRYGVVDDGLHLARGLF